jgi:hypothetical protein
MKAENGYPIRSEYYCLMRDLYYKGMGRLRSRGIKRQTLVRRILHQTRGQGIFFDYFFDFLLTEGEKKPKFTTEICYGVKQVCFLLVHYEVETNIFDI